MDYNIRCSGPTYEAYRLYAVVMVFVYPVGVPLLYALHLHRARYALDPSPFRANRLMNGVVRRSRAPDQKIHRVFNPMGSDRDLAETRASAAARDANTDDAYGAAYARLMELWARYGHLATAKAPVEEAILRRALVETVHDVPEFCASEKVDHLQFLFRPYSPECYYWEVCECARRLLLGAVLAVVRPNSSTQVAVGALGAALGSVAQAYARPYPPASKSLLSARPSPSGRRCSRLWAPSAFQRCGRRCSRRWTVGTFRVPTLESDRERARRRTPRRYIAKQAAKSPEDRAKELARLGGMKTKGTKPELLSWLKKRKAILAKMAAAAEL